MGFFKSCFNNDEWPLHSEYLKVCPSLHKLHQQGKYDELMASFIVTLFGLKGMYENLSPEGERKQTHSMREKAIQGLEGNMFDSTSNWLAAAYISHLSTTDQFTIKQLESLRTNFFQQAFQRFDSGVLSRHMPPEFASLTLDQRRNALRALGSWQPS